MPASSDPPSPTVASHASVSTDGKFLRVDGARFLVKGVTYGTFAPDASGDQFPPLDRVSLDFRLMAEHGINTVRVYTLPSNALLDEAARHGLRVMAGVPWTQHVAFLDDAALRTKIRRQLVNDIRRLCGHPALLMAAMGNEIPAPVVRWHGREAIEQFLFEAYQDVKAACPDTLLTYVNYPPTEYLDLSFFDVAAFNIYLHRAEDLRAYVTRLQHHTGARPLLLAELGADSQRNGLDGQAHLTRMQLDVAFREGACGAIAFAWTDEWWRGGFDVEDWAFGLVDKAREPKPALTAVEQVFAQAPYPIEEQKTWPKVSVVVCAYNAADTIDECLASLRTLTYPNVEVIVVNDGSKDDTGPIARFRYPQFRLIEVPNGGLSAARNIGLREATGEIVAYTDADVRVDPDWLTFLVQPFLKSDVVASGGPNVAPEDDPWVAQCVARAPGGPTHVMIDDRLAEHVPGCNMAFRRDVLLDLGGFNPIFLRAGDDVDVCWRLLARGWKIGFAPAALVWHHHRNTVRAYWRQQVGYGEGEQWLMPHHPDRFNNGQIAWRGHIYSPLPFVRALSRKYINAGPWGTAPFPSVYLRGSFPFAFMPHKIRWQVASLLLIVAGLIGGLTGSTMLGWVLGAVGVVGQLATMGRCVMFALRSNLPPHLKNSRRERLRHRVLIGFLHFIQPLARAVGLLRGIPATRDNPDGAPAPYLRQPRFQDLRGALSALLRVPVRLTYWGETWTDNERFLKAVQRQLWTVRGIGNVEVDDGWQVTRDISIGASHWCWWDLRVLVEEHGSGRCLTRVQLSTRLTRISHLVVLVTAVGTLLLLAGGSGVLPSVALAQVAWLFQVWLAVYCWRAAQRLRVIKYSLKRAARACDMTLVEDTPRRSPGARVPTVVAAERQS